MRIGMEFLKLLLIAGLMPLDAVEVYSAAPINYRLPENLTRPLSYNVKLKLEERKESMVLKGELAAEILITRPINNISLHSYKLKIRDPVTLTERHKDHRGTIVALNMRYTEETQILIINFGHKLFPGRYTLRIRYYAFFNDVTGFIKYYNLDATTDYTWSVLMTRPRPTVARSLFPCWDEPAFKSKFNISVQHPVKYQAASNMPIRGRSYNGDGSMWTHFEATPAMSTYLLSVVLTNLVNVPQNADQTINMRCRSFAIDRVELARNVSVTVENFLAWYTNRSKEIPEMKHIGIPDLTEEVAGKWGPNIYREEDLVYDEMSNHIDHKINVSITVAQKMAEYWFGNLISPRWWTHLWLSKTLAAFFGNYALSEVYPDMEMKPLFLFRIRQLAHRPDYAMRTIPITKEANSPDAIDKLYSSIYSPACCTKETAIMLMLENIMTLRVFREGVIEYVNKHQFSTATSDDFWSALQFAWYNTNDINEKHYDIKEFMETWITLKDYPVINVTRDYNTDIATITQYNVDILHDGDRKVDLWIPITYATESYPHFSETSFLNWFKPSTQSAFFADVNRDDWIIVNLQHTGYYRVNYDLKNWLKIAEYLNSENYNKIHVLNRAHLLDDAYYFLKRKEISPIVFWKLTDYLKQETDYIPWYSYNEILSDASNMLKLPASVLIMMKMLLPLEHLSASVGIEEYPMEDDNTKLKRVLVAEWTCRLNIRSKCREWATTKLEAYLTISNMHKEIMPWWTNWSPCSGMMNADISIWGRMLDKYKHNGDKEILDHLACSEDPDIVIYYLNLIATSCESVPANLSQDCDRIYRSIVEKHAQKDLVLEYLLEHFEETRPVYMTVTEGLIGIISNLYSTDNLKLVMKYVQDNPIEDPIKYDNVIQALADRKVIITEMIHFMRRFVLERPAR